MKKKYFDPEMEITEFEVEDVVTASDELATGSDAGGYVPDSDDF